VVEVIQLVLVEAVVAEAAAVVVAEPVQPTRSA